MFDIAKNIVKKCTKIENNFHYYYLIIIRDILGL